MVTLLDGIEVLAIPKIPEIPKVPDIRKIPNIRKLQVPRIDVGEFWHVPRFRDLITSGQWLLILLLFTQLDLQRLVLMPMTSTSSSSQSTVPGLLDLFRDPFAIPRELSGVINAVLVPIEQRLDFLVMWEVVL